MLALCPEHWWSGLPSGSVTEQDPVARGQVLSPGIVMHGEAAGALGWSPVPHTGYAFTGRWPWGSRLLGMTLNFPG